MSTQSTREEKEIPLKYGQMYQILSSPVSINLVILVSYYVKYGTEFIIFKHYNGGGLPVRLEPSFCYSKVLVINDI